ncbi:MAG: potassium/proton antiporter [Gammaproteobacteria bacterium]
MDDVNTLLFAGSLLLFTSILLSNLTLRLGVPLLLLFLGVGMLAGEDGPGGIQFGDFDTAFLVANLALAVILLDGGLRTRARSFRVALAPSLTLATLGVVVTAALLGAFVVAITGLDWRYGLLLGAIVGSTDAAAVFSLMRQSRIRLNERVTSTLEIESGANDPMAIFLVLVMVEWILSGEAKGGAALLSDFAQQFGLGGLGGVAGGFLLASLLARVQLAEGLYALLIVSGGLLLFSLVNALGGSGFLAVYLAGLVIGNRPTHATEHVLRVMDGLAWLSQAGMFLVLGLLVTPTEITGSAGLAVLLVLFLIFVARPVAVWLCLLPFRFPVRETTFIAWVGLRGAVPIVLALFPIMAGLKNAVLLFEVTFAVVLGSLLVQGTSVPWVARLLRVQLPTRERDLERIVLPVPMEPAPEIVTLPVEAGAPCVGRTALPLFEDISPAGASACSAIVRDGRLLFPSENERIVIGDVVIALVQPADEGRLLRAFTPLAAAERRSTQRFFGEFVLDGRAGVADVAAAYGIALAEVDGALTLAELLAERLGRRLVVGDRLKLEKVTLTVREIEDGVVRRVGLKLASRESSKL